MYNLGFLLYLVLLLTLGGALGYLFAKTLQVYAMGHRSGLTVELLWLIIAATTTATVCLGLLVRWF